MDFTLISCIIINFTAIRGLVRPRLKDLLVDIHEAVAHSKSGQRSQDPLENMSVDAGIIKHSQKADRKATDKASNEIKEEDSNLSISWLFEQE